MGLLDRIREIELERAREKVAAEAAAKAELQRFAQQHAAEEATRLNSLRIGERIMQREAERSVASAESGLQIIHARDLLLEAQRDVWAGYGSLSEVKFFREDWMPNQKPERLKDVGRLTLSYSHVEYRDFLESVGYSVEPEFGLSYYVETGRKWNRRILKYFTRITLGWVQILARFLSFFQKWVLRIILVILSGQVFTSLPQSQN